MSSHTWEPLPSESESKKPESEINEMCEDKAQTETSEQTLANESKEEDGRLASDSSPESTPRVDTVIVEHIATDASASTQAIFSGDKLCPFRLGDRVTFLDGKFPAIELTEVALVTELAVGFFARGVDQASSNLSEFFLEVYTSGQAPMGHADPEFKRILRQPVKVGFFENTPFSLFDESDSHSLEHLVEAADRQLSLQRIVSIFRGVLDLAISAHDQGYLVLGISPWTVRIKEMTQTSSTAASEAEVTASLDRVTDFTSDVAMMPTTLAEETNPDLPAYASDFELERGFTQVSVSQLDFNKPVENLGLSDENSFEFEAVVSSEVVAAIPEEATFEDDRRPVATLDEDYLRVELEEIEESLEIEDPEEVLLLVPPLEPVERRVGLNDSSEPITVQTSQAVVDDVALFDGLERLYPLGEMPASVPVITGFAASEFMLGVTKMVGPQADVFSLGALLFYLVTGHVPPSSIHSRFAPALPMRNFRPKFPPGLEAVVHRATCVEPEERYASVRQLRSDFEYAISQIEQRQKQARNARAFSVVRVAVDKHIGIAKGKRHPLNQDSVFSAVTENGRLGLVVVADGVTRATYGSGDKASSYVTAAAERVWKDVLKAYQDDGSFDPRRAINRILDEANEELIAFVNEHHYPFQGGVHEVMGSTVLIAFIKDGVVTLASLGDSRAYLSCNLGLEQLTTDHNLWTLNVIEGAVGIDYVRSMPYSEALARCLGSFKVVDGRLKALPSEPDIQEFFFRAGDRLILATDGLTDYIGLNRDMVEDAITGVLRREMDPALAALELILLANRGGGGDNIGIGIIDFH